MKRKEILIIVISLFVLVSFWIVFSVYHNSVTSTIPNALSLRILSIPNSFDTKTIESLKKRIQVAPLYEAATGTTTSAQVRPTPLPTPTLIPISGTLPVPASGTASAQATSGGLLR